MTTDLLGELGRIETLRLQEGDTLCLSVPHSLSVAERTTVLEHLDKIVARSGTTDVQVVVLEDGAKLSVIPRSDQAHAEAWSNPS